jgi:hypothetical protein
MEFKRKILGEGAKADAERKDEGHSRAKEDFSELQVRGELKESLFKDEEAVSGNKAAGTGADNTQPDEGAVRGRNRTLFKKVLIFGSPALCLVLAVAGFLFIKFKTQTSLFGQASQRLEPVTSIMRPIPQPDYREMLDFLLVYEIEGQKMITAIRMEIGYQSPTRYQNFKEQNVDFRDAVYSFLLKQNLSRNSVKSWHSVLEKDLLDCLRAKLPQSCADTIVLTQVENL